MSIEERELALLRHPRLAPLATSAWPAWLWSVDGSQIVWANAVGAAIFGGGTVESRTQLRLGAGDVCAGQIARLAPSLPTTGQERLERLRGFGAAFGRVIGGDIAVGGIAEGAVCQFMKGIADASARKLKALTARIASNINANLFFIFFTCD